MNLLTLDIAPGPPPAHIHALEIEPWLDADDRICARVFVSAESRWVDWPSVGLLSIPPTGDVIQAWPSEGMSADRLADFFNRRLQPLLLQARGYLVLHASAVQIGSHAVVLAGPSGCGKSTLAYALARVAGAQLADDAVVIDASGTHPSVVPLPFRPELKGAAQSLFQASGQGPVGAGHPIPLGVIVLPSQADDLFAPQLSRLSGPAACIALLSHAHVFDPSAETGALVSSFADLADRIPIWTLRAPAGLATLPAVVDAVRDVTNTAEACVS